MSRRHVDRVAAGDDISRLSNPELADRFVAALKRLAPEPGARSADRARRERWRDPELLAVLDEFRERMRGRDEEYCYWLDVAERLDVGYVWRNEAT